MKMKKILAPVLIAAIVLGPLTTLAADAKPAKPYPLKTCAVSDEQLGEMGDPYVFTYKDREVKLCCKSCLKDFNKEPAKYLKKIEAAGKK
jgi:hypothetical protein